MKIVWVIAKREIASFFDSIIAYVLIVAFLAMTGFLTWVSASNNVFVRQQADLQVFFEMAYWTLFVFIPAVTMRMLAEENRSGTIELLQTRAISNLQIVSGKFLGALLLVLAAVAFSLPYYISIARLGEVDHGAIICGYFALILMSGVYISIGILCSAFTNNQIVAFLITLLVAVFFHLIFGIISGNQTGLMGQVFNYLSMRTHFSSLSRGVIDLRDLTYFITLIVAGLALADFILKKRNS